VAARHPGPSRLPAAGRRVRDPDTATGLLEVKTSPFGDEWGPSGAEDGVPIHYRCQVMWQMDVLGLHRTHFARPHLRPRLPRVRRRVRRERRPASSATPPNASSTTSARATGPHRRRHGHLPDDPRPGRRPRRPRRRDPVRARHPLGRRLPGHGQGLRRPHPDPRRSPRLHRQRRRAVCEGRRIAYRTVRDGATYSLNPYTSKDAA
jgi:hypothetical protein